MSVQSGTKGTKDWHSSKQIRKRARHLLEHPDEEIPSDVTFLVGDGKEEPPRTFKCHKFILAMVSSMFQAMFYGSFPQAEDIIKIPDVTPKAFQYMLRYAYGENMDLDRMPLEDAMDILYCAKKYLIGKLARACRDHIQLDIVVLEMEDPYIVLQMAPQMDEDDLAVLALSRIAMDTYAMNGDDFLHLSFDTLKQIVEYPHLKAKEADIYKGVCRWVRHNVGVVTGSALRDAFGSLLYSIRFPLFSTAELADGPVKDGVLTGGEFSDIFQFLFGQVKPTLPFLTVPRIPPEASDYFFFRLVTAPTNAFTQMDDGMPGMHTYPDLAPECSAFLGHLVFDNLHIRIAGFDNEHVGKTVPLPTAVMAERNVLSHSVKGACWFEWDVEGGAACNVRIGTAARPHLYHSAVFGFIMSVGFDRTVIPLQWGDPRIQGVAGFEFWQLN